MPDASETIFKADCPSRAILDQVADKWSVIILGALCDKPARFNELRAGSTASPSGR